MGVKSKTGFDDKRDPKDRITAKINEKIISILYIKAIFRAALMRGSIAIFILSLH